MMKEKNIGLIIIELIRIEKLMNNKMIIKIPASVKMKAMAMRKI